MRNKTYQEVNVEFETVKKKITTLQNRQVSLNILHEMHRHGVTTPISRGFIAGNSRR
ncbi:MAG: hypothetical protein R3264_12080 [Anaerolineae bacterium]|nr:hypothetical protein [Anaerolineae bacterium]